MEMDIIHPCGHQHDLNDSLIESQDRYESDHYACPTCGMRWHIQKAPPILHKSGWVEPGKRTVVIDYQPSVTSPQDKAIISASYPTPPEHSHASS